MTTNTVATALTREHHEIDAGIEAFAARLTTGTLDTTVLASTLEALRRHIYLEEELLFPPIRRAGLLMPIMVMIKEHGRLWQLMDAIEAGARSDDPDPTSLRSACDQLLAALAEHNMKEEPIVYPQAASDITVDESAALEDFIESGSTPSDWICGALR